jgi:O-antigen ligase
VLNFSRLILLRDEMRHYGDSTKPIWAVEMGWNALPEGWIGEASPWGTDTQEKQADRLQRALARTQNEWTWLTGEFPLVLQPNVPADSPRWGFALLTPDGKPRELYQALSNFVASPPTTVPHPSMPLLPVFALLGVAGVSAWRAWHLVFALGLDSRWRAFKAQFNNLPEWMQLVILLIAVAAFYFSPNVLLNLALLALLVILFALRFDLGLALAIFVIPFWNFPKVLFGGFELSPVEVLTWIASTAFLMNLALNRVLRRDNLRIRPLIACLSTLDWAVLAFFILGLISTRWAGNFGVASREFRIVLLDPILLYGLIRAGAAAGITPNATSRYVTALLASGVAVCAIGLYQYFTGNVILADGVARLTAVWGSPNNVGLYLERLLPIALSFALLLHDSTSNTGAEPHRRDKENTIESFPHWHRWIYVGMVGLFALTILLTYSRGALFLGVPASVLFLMVVLFTQSHRLSRRAWLLIGATVAIAGIAILPFLSSDRFSSVFQTGTGTGFFRIAVWTSAVNMIADHPLLGVGLDNFLYEYPKYVLPEAWREPNLSHPHNFLLDAWVRLGIGGVLIFGWMLVAFFKRAWRTFTTTQYVYTRALQLGLMASVVAMLAHGLIDASYFVIDLAYVFLLTLAFTQTNPPSRNSGRRA